MDLVDTLLAHAQDLANGGEGLRWVAIEAVVSNHDLLLARWELVDKFKKRHRYLIPIKLFDYVIIVRR